MILAALLLAAIAGLRGLWSPCGLSVLTSLNPMAERSRGHRFWSSATYYVAGALIGGALLGCACAVGAAAVGLLSAGSTLRLGLAAAAALIGFASDARLFGRSLPIHPRQLNEQWLTSYRRWIYATGFGVQIGLGFATYIMTAAVYVLTALAVFTADPVLAFVICLSFAAVRGISIIVAAGLRTPDRLLRRGAQLERWSGVSIAVAIGAQAVAAVALGYRVRPECGFAVLLGVVAALLWRAVRSRGRTGQRRFVAPVRLQPRIRVDENS